MHYPHTLDLAKNRDMQIPADFHGKIISNGNLVHPHTGEVLGNPMSLDLLHSGPYVKICKDGEVVRIPLKGNLILS